MGRIRRKAPTGGYLESEEEAVSSTLDVRAGDDSVIPPACSLIVYHRDGSDVVPLTEGTSLVIGRTRAADFPLRDKSLSRKSRSRE